MRAKRGRYSEQKEERLKVLPHQSILNPFLRNVDIIFQFCNITFISENLDDLKKRTTRMIQEQLKENENLAISFDSEKKSGR